ncbi:hypothetical protein CTEN210_00529 [Chaetoceros tenuissimus]|uniref:Leucine-rich repeat domain-containing protein n=1 Tax=Chaetoceros tenuissimus TaxID=426638 RepID=A0AAD3CG81_9STRA|nr:hypothetical protein CTEN210_00529 [Chaetoceros tenuissimus]
MRVATVDGLVTLFYDGTKELFDEDLQDEWDDELLEYDAELHQYRCKNIAHWESWDLSNECKQYFRERLSWEQIIVEEGVTVIPISTFSYCCNIKKVILANTVIKIEAATFYNCSSLVYVKWSMSLEFIGPKAFFNCNLSSVFLPPSCRKIDGDDTFARNENLKILNVPNDTKIDTFHDIYIMIHRTELLERSPFECTTISESSLSEYKFVNTWIKTLNNDEKFVLHKVCCSYQPTIQDIHTLILDKGFKAFQEKNNVGITPSEYLAENPYASIKEMDIIQYFIQEMTE